MNALNVVGSKEIVSKFYIFISVLYYIYGTTIYTSMHTGPALPPCDSAVTNPFDHVIVISNI